LTPLQLARDESGVEILLRQGKRPIGYLLRETEPEAYSLVRFLRSGSRRASS
jgi:hypothetical protein